jgi:hypothetical protein
MLGLLATENNLSGALRNGDAVPPVAGVLTAYPGANWL